MYTQQEIILFNIFMKRMVHHHYPYHDASFKPVSVFVRKFIDGIIFSVQFDGNEPNDVSEYRKQIKQLAASYGLDVFVSTLFLGQRFPKNYFPTFDYIMYRDFTTEGNLTPIS